MLCWPYVRLSWTYLGPMSAVCCARAALCEPYVGPCRPYVGLTWPYLAPMLALCSPTCTLSCPMLTLCWPKLPLSCPYIDPMFAYVGRTNALPHSSDRNGGGGDGVGTGSPQAGRRLGRHASITFGYHRRPPARTRAVAVGRRPDLKADA